MKDESLVTSSVLTVPLCRKARLSLGLFGELQLHSSYLANHVKSAADP